MKFKNISISKHKANQVQENVCEAFVQSIRVTIAKRMVQSLFLSCKMGGGGLGMEQVAT